jgi:hypothetical protein
MDHWSISMFERAHTELPGEPVGKLNLIPWVPAIVAVANGILVAMAVMHQTLPYPTRLLWAQIAIVLVSLLLASRNRWVRLVGFLLVIVTVVATFSAIFLYAPTFIAAIWRLAKWTPQTN